MSLLSLITAYIFTRKKDDLELPAPDAGTLAIAVGAAVVVFAVASPCVLLDFSTFLRHFSLEREHMALGRFGAGGSPTWSYYVRILGGTTRGWPLLLLALGGLLYFVIRRRLWALLVSSFLVPYFVGISTWEMRAPRYVLPVVPLLLLFAGGLLGFIINRDRLARYSAPLANATVAIVIVLAAIPLLMSFPEQSKRTRPDTRTLATRWVHENVPQGSYIVTESYGPDLMLPDRLEGLTPEIKERIIEGAGAAAYAALEIPVFQTRAWRSQVFYDVSLYEDADYIVTSGTVRSRYMQEPTRYRRQVEFYKYLDEGFHEVQEFLPVSRDGPAIKIYKNPRHSVPFGRREVVRGPGTPPTGDSEFTAQEALFYVWMGYNYEKYRFYEGALESYRSGLSYTMESIEVFRRLVFGVSRCLVNLGRRDEAVVFLDRAIESAPTPPVRELIRQLKQRIEAIDY